MRGRPNVVAPGGHLERRPWGGTLIRPYKSQAPCKQRKNAQPKVIHWTKSSWATWNYCCTIDWGCWQFVSLCLLFFYCIIYLDPVDFFGQSGFSGWKSVKLTVGDLYSQKDIERVIKKQLAASAVMNWCTECKLFGLTSRKIFWIHELRRRMHYQSLVQM